MKLFCIIFISATTAGNKHEFLNHILSFHEPVSYTHLTLPTILLV